MLQISGLEVPYLVEDYLPQLVSSYNLGPLPVINGKLWDAKWKSHRNVTVEARYGNPLRWAICDGGFCLSKKNFWEYENQPSERTDEFLENFRFDSALDAATFYFNWKAATIEKAKAVLAENPKAILEL